MVDEEEELVDEQIEYIRIKQEEDRINKKQIDELLDTINSYPAIGLILDELNELEHYLNDLIAILQSDEKYVEYVSCKYALTLDNSINKGKKLMNVLMIKNL